MAIMNRVGALLYNISLFLTIGILFLTLKNFNIVNPGATLDYSLNLKFLIFVLLGLFYAFSLALSISALISKARKKRFFFTLLMLWMWAMIALNILFAFLPDILRNNYTTPGWRYSIIMVTVVLTFVPALGLILHQFPGSVDEKIMVKEVKEEIEKEETRSKSYCPVCRYPSEKEWKFCPKCGARFAD